MTDGGTAEAEAKQPFRQEAVWFILLPATRSLADFVIGARREQTKTAPEGAVQAQRYKFTSRVHRVVAATEMIVQANLDGVDLEVMIEVSGAAGRCWKCTARNRRSEIKELILDLHTPGRVPKIFHAAASGPANAELSFSSKPWEAYSPTIRNVQFGVEGPRDRPFRRAAMDPRPSQYGPSHHRKSPLKCERLPFGSLGLGKQGS